MGKVVSPHRLFVPFSRTNIHNWLCFRVQVLVRICADAEVTRSSCCAASSHAAMVSRDSAVRVWASVSQEMGEQGCYAEQFTGAADGLTQEFTLECNQHEAT
jgi:hypothetical protein